MRSIRRTAALVTVLGMPVIAYLLGRGAVALGEEWDFASLPDADAGVALQNGLTLAATAFGAAIACYLAVTGYAMILGAAWRGGRGIPKALAAVVPSGWTSVTATAMGLSMSAGLAGPALASASAPPTASAGWVPEPVSVIADAAARPVVGWVPAAVTPAGWVQPPVIVAVGTDPRPTAAPPAAPLTTSPAYVVQPGDSLWRIAESLLGDSATTADVAAAWPSLYDANREAIGENPSLIHPGLTLTIPEGLGA